MPLFISFISGVFLFQTFAFFPFSSLLAGVAVTGFLFFRKRAPLTPVVIIGVLYALLRPVPAPGPSAEVWNRQIRMTGSFVRAPSPEESGTFLVEEAFDEESGEEIGELDDSQVTVFPDEATEQGGSYEVLLKTGKDPARRNPDSYGIPRVSGRIMEADPRGEYGPGRPFVNFSRYRGLLNNFFRKSFGRDSAALLSAVTTGEKGYLSEEIRDDFNAAGLAHVLSISGTHFGLFSVILFGGFVFLVRRLPHKTLLRLSLYFTPSQVAAVLCIPFLIFYLGLSGANVPAVRSFVVVTLFLAGLLIGRKGAWLNSLCFAAFLLVLWEPGVMMGLSFQLSFIAVLFIGFAMVQNEKDEDPVAGPQAPWGLRIMRNSVVMTFAASVGTAPLAAYHFHSLSVVSPLSNLVVTPLIGFVLVPLSLFSSLCFLLFGYYPLATVIGFLADMAVRLVGMLSAVPFASLRVPAFPPVLCVAFYAGFLVYLLSGRPWRLFPLPFLPFIFYLAVQAGGGREMSVTFLDVGQGDASVLELPDGKTVVVDTGRTGREVASFLKSRGKSVIDALVLSHVHPDHCGGFSHLMERFKVKEVWDNGLINYPTGWDRTVVHRVLRRGDILESAGVRIVVLHPYEGFHLFSGDDYNEENNSSLVFKVTGRRSSLLFAGDIEDEAEYDLTRLGKRLRSDLLKVPHHGSRTSAGEDFLSVVSPSLAIISVGRDNTFGHPSPEVIGRLRDKQTLRTDRDGAVKVTEKADGLHVRTYSGFEFARAESAAGEWRNFGRLFTSW